MVAAPVHRLRIEFMALGTFTKEGGLGLGASSDDDHHTLCLELGFCALNSITHHLSISKITSILKLDAILRFNRMLDPASVHEICWLHI